MPNRHVPARPSQGADASDLGGPLTVERALSLVASWSDLPAQRRRDLASALSSVARVLGLPAGSVLLTPAALRGTLLSRSAAAYGFSEARMRNIRSALRFVLRRLDVIDDAHGPISERWEALLRHFHDRERITLIGLARFCSLRQIAPESVDDGTLEAFLAQLTERTLTTNPRKVAAHARGRWNQGCATIEGWPGRPLAKLRGRGHYVLPLAAFPEAFRQDLAAFGRRLAGPLLDDLSDEREIDEDDDAPLGPSRPLRAVTVELRQNHCRWAASALVATGVPAAEVTSLASLVEPLGRARAIVRFLYRRAGKKPSAAGQHVAEVLRIVAKHHVCLPEKSVARIQQWGREVQLTYKSMTQKNEASIRAAMTPAHDEALLLLPGALLRAARTLRPTAPREAAALALRAVAVEILTKIPLRLANLVGLRLDRHLQRADPRGGLISAIMIPAEETKNKDPICMPVSAETAAVIDEWLKHHRPVVAAPGCVYLLPGHGTGNKPVTPQGLRDAIKAATGQHVGVVLSPHQFRHLAARRFLDACPGHYEEVRQLLGHASVVTTVRHYSGIESESAACRFDEVILNRRARLARSRPHPSKASVRSSCSSAWRKC